MAECKHKFIGYTDGVTCAYCGSHWSHTEYVRLISEGEDNNPLPPKSLLGLRKTAHRRLRMELFDKIMRVKTLLDADAPSDNVITMYLGDAKDAILDRLYPFDRPTDCVLPEKYDRLQCELAIRYITRRGAEGEVVHAENGISHTYGSVNDEDLLSRVTPYIKVV